MSSLSSLHSRAFSNAISEFKRLPVHFFLNLLVLAMTLALPFAAYTLYENVSRISGHLSAAPEVTVFLKHDVTREQAQDMRSRLVSAVAKSDGSAKISFIPKEDALASLSKETQARELAEAMEMNPLPDSYVITFPSADDALADKTRRIKAALTAFPEVDSVMVDEEWMSRLAALTGVLKTAFTLTMILLALVVVTVTFNAIRLVVLSRIDEITLCWHLGATRSYIRRPFFYYGTLLGLFAGVIAVSLVFVLLIPLNRALSGLSAFYHFDVHLSAPSIGTCVFMIVSAMVLCWIGALLSVNRQLSRVE